MQGDDDNSGDGFVSIGFICNGITCVARDTYHMTCMHTFVYTGRIGRDYPIRTEGRGRSRELR